MNYYTLFELAETPRVDKQLLAAKYIALQKKYHPDFFTTDTETAQEEALEISAQINKAYNTFKNEDKTLAYFLAEKGIIVADEKYNLPADFLMEMMELNEAIEEQHDVSLTVSQFETALQKEIETILVADRATVFTDIELQQLKAYYYKKKYLQRILERLED
jgi:molecular chaperone HscB